MTFDQLVDAAVVDSLFQVVFPFIYAGAGLGVFLMIIGRRFVESSSR